MQIIVLKIMKNELIKKRSLIRERTRNASVVTKYYNSFVKEVQ